MAQGLRVRLPRQGARAPFLLWAIGPPCCGAMKPVRHSHGVHPGDPAPHPRSPRAAVKTRGGHDREMNVNGLKKNKDSLILTGHESPHVLGCQDHQVNMAVKPFLELH